MIEKNTQIKEKQIMKNIILLLLLTLIPSIASAAAKIVVDDTKWVSIGAGLRTTFTAVEDGADGGDSYSKDFAVQSVRLYLNGQLHENLKLEFNTECHNDCTVDKDVEILDAIVKFEFMSEFNVWAGRMLQPTDRIELNGPYFGLTWNQYNVALLPADYSTGNAGQFGRDEGVTVWGSFDKFQYAVGIFDGLEGGANVKDNMTYVGRFSYNFLNKEPNPGYYTSSTYFGEAGDIFTVAFAVQHQSDGTGTATEQGDFTAYLVDYLFEKPLGDDLGVLTIEGEYKIFDAETSAAALADPSCFCMFDGDAFFVSAAYLLPKKFGIGQFQPYVRYVENTPDGSNFGRSSDLYELGTNYIISGHNAKVNFNYTSGDASLTGRAGSDVNAFSAGVQFQF